MTIFLTLKKKKRKKNNFKMIRGAKPFKIEQITLSIVDYYVTPIQSNYTPRYILYLQN